MNHRVNYDTCTILIIINKYFLTNKYMYIGAMVSLVDIQQYTLSKCDTRSFCLVSLCK